MIKTRRTATIVLILFASVSLLWYAYTVCTVHYMWEIVFDNNKILYPVYTCSNGKWIVVSSRDYNDGSAFGGNENSLIVIRAKDGAIVSEIKHLPSSDNALIRSRPVIINDTLLRFSRSYDGQHHRCELRALRLTESNGEEVLYTWIFNTSVFAASFGDVERETCPVVVQYGIDVAWICNTASWQPLSSMALRFMAHNCKDIDKRLIVSFVSRATVSDKSISLAAAKHATLPILQWTWPPIILQDGGVLLYERKDTVQSKTRAKILNFKGDTTVIVPHDIMPYGSITRLGESLYFDGSGFYLFKNNAIKSATLPAKSGSAMLGRDLIFNGRTISELNVESQRLLVFSVDTSYIERCADWIKVNFYATIAAKANGEYTYMFGKTDSRPMLVQSLAKAIPIVNMMWSENITDGILQVNTMQNEAKIIAYNEYPVIERNVHSPLLLTLSEKWNGGKCTLCGIRCRNACSSVPMCKFNYYALLTVIITVVLLFIYNRSNRAFVMSRRPEG